jgi:ankyrin repeat protein
MKIAIKLYLSCLFLLSASLQAISEDPDINAMVDAASAMFWDISVPYVLASNHISIDKQDNRGYTALMEAAELNNKNAVRVLLHFGANPFLKNNSGIEAIGLTTSEDIKKMLSAKMNINDIVAAASSGVNVLRNFLNNNHISIDTQDNRGYTALMEAAELHNKNAVRALLSAGADPSLKDNFGRGAIALAERSLEISQLIQDEINRRSKAQLRDIETRRKEEEEGQSIRRLFGEEEKEEQGDTCRICLDKLSEDKNVTLKCGHKFDKECLEAYAATSNKCPLCRKPIQYAN